jgi:hypothetical protein
MIETTLRLRCDGCRRPGPSRLTLEQAAAECVNNGWAITTFEGGALCPECLQQRVGTAQRRTLGSGEVRHGSAKQ